MREFIINIKDGDEVQGLQSNRNFFYFEIESLNKLLENTYQLINREVRKNVSIIVDGHKLFDDEVLLGEKSLYDLIDQQLDRESKKTIEEYIRLESELINDSRFKDFIVRYDEVLCNPDVEPIPYFLSVKQMYEVFKKIIGNVEHLFYSKFSVIMQSLYDLNEVVLTLVDVDENTDSLEVSFSNFLNDEENFQKYCQYVPSKMSSLSFSRISALYPNYRPYQRLQDILFKKTTFYLGFEKCFRLHQDLLNAFKEEFHLKLFLGDLLLEDEHFNVKVIYPVIKTFHSKVYKEMERFVQENGYGKEVLLEIKTL